jgi:large subunit ribosomal protein L25
MIKLSAKIRKETGKKTNILRKADIIPAVVYGHKIKNVMLEIEYKDFQKVYSKAGVNSLIELDVAGEKEKKIVLIHDYQKDPVTDKFIHVDFFETSAKEEVEVKIPLVFEGTALAVKELGGTFVKNISELQVKALPQNLPHEIKVSIDGLNTFENRILVKDLNLPKDVKVSAKPDEIVAFVAQPSKIEEELAKEIEEKVEDVEKVEKKEKKEEVIEEEKPAAKPAAKPAEQKK